MTEADKNFALIGVIDDAYEQDTLAELICDCISFGYSLEEFYEQAKENSKVPKEAVDKAVEYLRDNKLIEEIKPKEEEYRKIDEELDDYYLTSDYGKNIFEGVVPVKVDTTTVGDLLDGAMDNMPQEQIDDEINFFQAVAEKLGVRQYPRVVVAVDDGDYNPQWVLQDGQNITLGNREVVYYPSAKMILEECNNLFLYFANKSDASKYYGLAHKFLDHEELNKDVFAYDMNLEEETHGYFTEDGEFIEDEEKPRTLEEALNKLDKITGNKYDLLNTYLDENLDDSGKEYIVSLLEKDNSPKLIHDYLNDGKEDSLSFLKKAIEEGAESGELTINSPEQLRKTIAYLKWNNIPYDTYDVPGGSVVTWFIDNTEESRAEVDRKTIKMAKANLQKALGLVDGYLKGEYFTEERKKDLLQCISDALYDCKDVFED